MNCADCALKCGLICLAAVKRETKPDAAKKWKKWRRPAFPTTAKKVDPHPYKLVEPDGEIEFSDGTTIGKARGK